jgi:CelD/BcsL family acetyltransferase involved in cellulose biosynthesis
MNTGNLITGRDSGSLSIEEINDVEKFRDLRESWNALLRKSGDDNIFLTWEWLFNWWQSYGSDKKLRIIVIRNAENIIGIVPLMQQKYKQWFISIDVIENLCSENCDYSGVILAEKKPELITLLTDYLAKIVKDEKLIVRIYHIPGNSQFLTLIREQYPLLSNNFYIQEIPSSYCPYITLPSTWDEYVHTLSRNNRRNMHRTTQSLEKDHVVELIKYSGGKDLQDKLNILFEFHQKRWGVESKFTGTEARQFYFSVSKALAQNNWLDFSSLCLDGKPVCMIWGFIYNNIFWAMTIAFDPDYYEYSVGYVHIMKLIENTIHNGLKKFDFLKGDEGFKYHWTSAKTDNVRITLAQNSSRGKYRVKLLQALIKYRNARERGFHENVNLFLKKVRPQGKPGEE